MLDVGQFIDVVGAGGPRNRHLLNWEVPRYGMMILLLFYVVIANTYSTFTL